LLKTLTAVTIAADGQGQLTGVHVKLVVDGVCFQLAEAAIARVWSMILPRLAAYADLDIVLLDRGACPPIAGVQSVEFPSYTMTANTATDSILIDEFCRGHGADVFVSTQYTTPLTTPSILMIYDLIPEVFGFGFSQRSWQEKQIAISFASYYVCLSENARSDLKRSYKGVNDERAIVIKCGVDHNIFHPRDPSEVREFKDRFVISRPYYLLSGPWERCESGSFAFDAAQSMRDWDFELLAVGCEPKRNCDIPVELPAIRRLELSNNMLACAYSEAKALILSAPFEGYGLTAAEAMACGCPVITTRPESLGEVWGDATLRVSSLDEDEMRRARAEVCDHNRRKTLIENGLKQAAQHSWDETAGALRALLRKAADDCNRPATQNFLREWARLRAIQAAVDVE
jgi:glycosyltransferase involved in cell wall biosynthesis